MPVIAPLVVGILGAGGAAWAAGLKPYSGWLLAGSAAMLAYGFWSAYRTRPDCAVAGARARARATAIARGLLWLAAALWLGAVATNLLVPS